MGATPGRPPEPTGPPRRLLLAVVAAVVLVAVVVLALLYRPGDPGPADGATTAGPSSEPTGPTAGPGTTGPAAAPSPTPFPDRTVDAAPLADRLGTEVVDAVDPGVPFTLEEPGWASLDGAPDGAREAVTGTLTDGTDTVGLTAVAFDSIEEQDAHAEEVVAGLREDGATVISEGTVYSDGSGRHWAFLMPDGVSSTVVWRTDDGVVLTLTGPLRVTEVVYGDMLV
ncbi:hypothetical protein V5H98_13320 [Georgenia sp. M64]|uniref:hypothetical protein n=1 Tax=Georgenia sp. M64 TaxID=3120520 RepID=UPI0030E128ED